MGKDNGSKVLDTEVLTTFCAVCKQLDNDNKPLAKIAKQNCKQNHDGCAGKMETDGIVRIFKRSQEKYGLRYTRYLGDGDSKSYAEVCKSGVYDNIAIVKEECCGHVQKRMGKALMSVVEESKGKSYVVSASGQPLSS